MLRVVITSIHSILIVLFCTTSLFAQTSNRAILTGKVSDEFTGAPLADVNVFIANSMLGSSTSDSGFFRIESAPLGTHVLIARHVGYELKKIGLRLTKAEVKNYDITLVPKAIKAPEIEIVGSKVSNWKKDLLEFKRYFFGISDNAKKCKILNEEALDFRSHPRSASFSAIANDVLIIENKALGYRLQYLLEEFELQDNVLTHLGIPKFDEIEPKNEKDKKKIAERRRKTYNGSMRHFLAALTQNQVQEEGFLVYNRSLLQVSTTGAEKVITDQFVDKGELPFERNLEFTDYLQVVYPKEKETSEYREWSASFDNSLLPTMTKAKSTKRAQTSWLLLTKTSTVIDTTGYVYNPRDILIYGYWSSEGVADYLPLEYTPE